MPEFFPSELLRRLSECRIAAGFSVEHAEEAVPLAQALLAGGIKAVELTLRTAAGIDGVAAICTEVPEMLVGVGTILTPETATQVAAIGAHFGVAPGFNRDVVLAAHDAGLPFAPGIATPTELEAAIALGCRFVKFFPAQPLGGVRYLRSMGAPYKHLDISYFPLGGVNADNMMDYLNEPNVPIVGGTWVVERKLVEQRNWQGITDSAAAAVGAADKGVTNA